MNKIKSLITLLAVCLLAIPQVRASKGRSQTEQPIITIHCDAYKTIGAENSFGLMLGSTETDYFDIDCGFGLEEMEVEPWILENGEIVGTYKSVRVSEQDEIRIYGDAEKIDMIKIQGGYVTSIDMDQCVNLEVLDLSHNTLRELDLTPFTNLYAIYLSDNPFTVQTPLKIGTPKNNLAILEIDIVDHLDQSFNLSDYPSMQAFDAYHNTDLWNLDPSGCPNLLTMSLELTNVSTLDVSNNPNLVSLNISDTRISSIDLSNNTALNILMAEHSSGWINKGYYLENIDLSPLSELKVLYLGGNNLSSLDISNNTQLTNLNLTYNKLTSIDLSNNQDLYSVNLRFNDMDFATLPAPVETWGEYYYEQNLLPVPKSIGIGQSIDLSARVLREGTETTASVWIKPLNSGVVELDQDKYTYSDGVITFHEATTDSIYVSFANSLLNEYALATTSFMVKKLENLDKPSPMVVMAPANFAGKPFSAFVGMAGASEEHPKKFYIDFGDGKQIEYQTTASTLPEAANAIKEGDFYSNITIYIPEGEILTALGMKDLSLRWINLQNSTGLTELKLENTGLGSIDLQYNPRLTYLNLDGNELTELDLSGLNPSMEKNSLLTFSAANNELETVTFVSKSHLNSLNLSGNKLTEFSLKDFDRLKVIDLSNNLLEDQFSLTYQIDAESIDLSNNNISGILYDYFNYLNNFNVTGNKLTFATIPYQIEATNFIYGPQQPVQLPRKAPAVNLSDLNRVNEDGQGTTFVWKKADGTLLVEGVEYTENNGATKFLDEEIGKVYCEMTNPAFPQLSGENILRTTEMEVVGAPTIIVATFTTLEDSNSGEVIFASKEGTDLLIDWRGDGSEYSSYYAPQKYAPYEGVRTFKDAEVKVYTYDSPHDVTVFSTYGIKMKNFNGEPMQDLTALSICDAGLSQDDIILPQADLTELKLYNNAISEYLWYEQFPNLKVLNLQANNLTSFDAGRLPKLTNLYLGMNEMTDVTLNNNYIWELDLSFNQFDQIDFSKTKGIEQLWLSNNNLAELNLRTLRSSLAILDVSNNRFSFATLPAPTDFPYFKSFYYSNQAYLVPEISNDYMTFDLSSQALIKDMYETTYIWFLGEPIFDSETGELSGEQLIVDDEYTIENGVTTFNYKFSDDVVCVMINPLFPKSFLRTAGYRVGYEAAVEDVSVDSPRIVDVYNLSGFLLKQGVPADEALSGLPSGLYIVGGKKIYLRN